MFRWYAIHSYSGHEAKVKGRIEQRIASFNQLSSFRRIVIPTESVIETKNGQKVQVERRTMPGYVLIHMEMGEDAWMIVKGTQGVIGFVGAGDQPMPLLQGEVDRMLKIEHAGSSLHSRITFAPGEMIKVTSGPLADFDGQVLEVNEDQHRLKVAVSIFERQVPVDLEFGQVKKVA